MAFLNKKQIFETDDIETVEVDVPEWGGKVNVIMLTGAQRDAFEMSFTGKNGKVTNIKDVRARLCALVVVDEKGDRVFFDADIPQLSRKSSAALDRIFSIAQKLNRMTDDDVEELAKN